MSTVTRLTNTSFIVLGLVEVCQPATPYDLKRLAQASVVNFWALPHTQLYTECARLAEVGYLDEEREEGGRRRRVYRMTDDGRAALDAWRAEPTSELIEIHDVATLKLFFGADPGPLAEEQLDAHRAKLRAYERVAEEMPDMPPGMRLALECGIGHEHEFVRFWSRLAEGGAEGPELSAE